MTFMVEKQTVVLLFKIYFSNSVILKCCDWRLIYNFCTINFYDWKIFTILSWKIVSPIIIIRLHHRYLIHHNWYITDILNTPLQWQEAAYGRVLYEKVVLKDFDKFGRKIPVLESLSEKVAGRKACNFIKERLQHRCFTAKFTKFLRSDFHIQKRKKMFYSLQRKSFKKRWKMLIISF